MSEQRTDQKTETRRRPKRLARKQTPASQAMLTRALGDNLPRLDVAAFNSSI